jgi:uncharacterized protein YbjT (DUF2867 family)
MTNNRRVLVTGGGTFLGDNIAAALLAEGAEVTLLVRPGLEHNLGILGQRLRWGVADVWDPASLRGRARGHGIVIHTVGSMTANPEQGLTHHRLNFVSSRNVATMCVSDGVGHLLLMSSTRAPWVSRQYLRAKREAEQYLQRVGVKGTIIRAPLAYLRGARRSPFFEFMTLLGSVPPLSWTVFGRIGPMPVDILARGVARIALDQQRTKTIYYASDLRRRNSRQEMRGLPLIAGLTDSDDADATQPRRTHPFETLDDDTPFGWTPPSDTRRK